jgi:hypothetical protein
VPQALGVEELAVDSHADEADDDVVGELDGVDERSDGLEAFLVDQLEQQGEEFGLVDAGAFDVEGFGGNAIEEVVEGFPGNGAIGDEVVAKASAILGLEDDGVCDLLRSDEFRLEEEIPEAHAN